MNSIKKGYFVFYLLISTISWSQQFEGDSELVYSLNSPFGEDFIALHPKGKEMAITRLIHPYNQDGNSDSGDIWKSVLDSGAWTSTNWHALRKERRRAQRQRAPIQGIPYQEVLMVGKAGRVGDRHITIPAVRRLR